jgi:hypothetical protein
MGARPEDNVGDDYKYVKPWSHDETAKNIDMVKKYFDALFWEFGFFPMTHYEVRKINDFEWALATPKSHRKP